MWQRNRFLWWKWGCVTVNRFLFEPEPGRSDGKVFGARTSWRRLTGALNLEGAPVKESRTLVRGWRCSKNCGSWIVEFRWFQSWCCSVLSCLRRITRSQTRSPTDLVPFTNRIYASWQLEIRGRLHPLQGLFSLSWCFVSGKYARQFEEVVSWET